MKEFITKMKGKKVLSLLLAMIMVLSVASPAMSPKLSVTAEAATDNAPDAYATIITASDFQDGRSGNLYEANFSTMMKKAKAAGLNEPDGFILGGDYDGSYADKHDTPKAYKRVESVITSVYPHMNKKNIVNIQGNHDVNDPSVIDKTGPHEFDDYIVYVINLEDYPAGTGKEDAKNTTIQTNNNLVAYFNELKAEGETRPIFIATHIPLHHNSRNPKAANEDGSKGWNETRYSKILFDTINENAEIFDIVFLFGHNHSDNYDDDFGGSVNYWGKDEKIRIPKLDEVPSETSYTEETLNFTYMNYGYVGYSNNKTEATLTMNTFEICSDKIVATRYSTAGKYGESKIIDRNMKTDVPSVYVDGYSEAEVGSATGAVAIASGFENPVYTWSSTNPGIAKVSGTDRAAEIVYNNAGTATIKVKVAEGNDPTKNATYSYKVMVSEKKTDTPAVSIYRAKEQVNGGKLEYYKINLGDTVALSGGYKGFTENASATWSSSNERYAKVNQQGLVTFVGSGTAIITYKVTDNDVEYSASVTINVSTGNKIEYKYVQVPTTSFEAGNKYVFANGRPDTPDIYNENTGAYQGDGLSGTDQTMQGSAGNYWFSLDDESFVWNAIAVDPSNPKVCYLQNEKTGRYMYTEPTDNDTGETENDDPEKYGDFKFSDTPNENGKWYAIDSGLLYNGTHAWYLRGNGQITALAKDDEYADQKDNFYLFKQVPEAASATIEFTGEVVNNTNKTIYFATKGRQITLEGDYFNIENPESETWSSSEPSVATIDQNGVVTFKGVKGETVIKYTVTDDDGTEVPASFTLSAVLTAEKTYWFKYTDKLEQNKEYIIVNKKAATAGSYALAFSGFKVDTSKLLADRVDITVEDGVPHIEIPQSFTDVVWTTEDAGNSAFCLKNKGSEEYLNVTTTGETDTSGPVGTVYTNATNEATAGYKWTYDPAGKLYSDLTYTTDGATENVYVRVRTGEFPGTSTQNASEIYFFEKVGSKPKAIITSSFEAIDEAVERLEVCPSQTETFTPFADGFDDNNAVTFAWSSSNATIATIDPSGKLTYTGKEGEVAITLTATGTLNGETATATETVVITVVGGEGYVDPHSNTTYTENAFYKTDELVPGRRYVLHTEFIKDTTYTQYEPEANLAIGNSNESDYTRLRCYSTSAPQTDGNGEYIATTDTKIIWECLSSDVPGYVYLKNTANNTYLFTSEYESLTNKRQAGVAAACVHPYASSVSNPEDTFLLKYETNLDENEHGSVSGLRSKQLVDSGSAYFIGNVAIKSSGSYKYIRPTTADSSSFPSTITLYAEPVAEAEKKSDKYYLTNNFVAGQKYVFASSNSAGTAYAMDNRSESSTNSGYDFQNSDEIKIVNTDNKVYVTDPAKKFIWECEAVSGEPGYFYLKNASSDQYLAVLDDPATETDLINGSVTTGELNASTLEADEFKLTVVGNKITSKQSQNLAQPYYMYFWGDESNHRFHAKNNSDATVFLYAFDESEVTKVSVQTEIRKQDDFGSVNITRILQNRYNVNNGDTEQLLQYIRGVASGYTAKWSVSDTSIATIGENTGLLTFTGETGYFNVVLTVTGQDFNGNPVNRTVKTAFNVSVGQVDTKVAVPETVYMTPADGASKIGQIYVNNVMDHDNNYEVKTVAAREDDMYFGLRVAGAKSFIIQVSNVTEPANDIEVYNTTTGANVENVPSEFTDGMIEVHSGFGLRFSENSAGLQPGEKATAKWDITVTMNDGNKRSYTFYTVMYAPHRTVGAVAEARQVGASQHEISSWITGANGVDHSKWSPLGSFHADRSAAGYFIDDPLYNQNPPTYSTNGTPNDLINVVVDYPAENTKYENAYVVQSATNDHDSSTAKSYLGLLTVDKSRYTNTNQIPNLKIGYDALRISTYKKNSLGKYTTYYTLGTSQAFTATEFDATPTGWNTYSSYTNIADDISLPYRESFVPSFAVGDSMDGKYIHALNNGKANQALNPPQYSTAGTSVLCSVTDKAMLRELVVSAYNITTAENSTFTNELQAAATVLGDPSASQANIDKASDDLYNAMGASAGTYYALKYDNLFSAFEYYQKPNSMKMNVSSNASISYNAGTFTVISDNAENVDIYATEGSDETYYYNVSVEPSTEYIFEYDVETDAGSQVLLFFYDENGNQVASTNQTIQINYGNPLTVTSSPHLAAYVKNDGHVVLKFKTNEYIDRIGFRFGNTDNVVNKSTFSNIRLIDAAHYYEDALYSKTESLHKEYTTYGSLMTPKRPGYSFKGWKDINGGLITGVNTAIDHLTVYSQWNVEKYTVKFDPNGGSGSVSSQVIDIENSATLPEPTRGKYTLLGWAFSEDAKTPDIQLGQEITVSDVYGYLDANNKVTLYAVWQGDDLNVTFDNLVDMIEWEKLTPNNAVATDFTGNGFTLTSKPGAGEGTFESPEFKVTAGKQYKIDVDVEGDNWDVYIFFRNETVSDTGIDFSDGKQHFSSNGDYIFTAPSTALKAHGTENNYTADATKAIIRVDANGSNNTVKFSNIRVYEVGTVEDGVSYEASKTVTNGKKYGELPVPTRYGYNFKGWYTADGVPVSEDVIVDSAETINLFSKWVIQDPQLAPDTVVIDFGLPVTIDVTTNDINMSGGKLTAVAKDNPNVTLNTQSYETSQLANASTNVALANGTAEIKDDKVVYTPASTNYTAEEVFYYEYQTANGQYYYTTVTVIPATSIYFEETFMNFKDSGKYKWQDVGESITDRFQAEDRPGTFTFADADADNVYGTDAAYNDSTTYSMGRAKFVDVDKASIKNEPSAEFTFTGTGFDLFSVTDNKAGAIRVYIYRDTDEDGDVADETTHYKNKVISTYYGYEYDTEKGVYNPITDENSAKAVFQVPVVKFRDLDYDTYRIVVKPMYSSGYDATKAGHYGIYVDSVRIFDPMGEKKVANEVYLADGEFAPNYLEIRDTILKKDENGNVVVGTYEENGSLFFDGSANNGTVNYAEVGPKNEVYLGKGQAIVFDISSGAIKPSTLQLGMKLIDGRQGKGTVSIFNTANVNKKSSVTLTSATEQFYKIDSVAEWVENNGVYETASPIVIQNTSTTDVVISLTTLKWAYAGNTEEASSFRLFVDEQTPVLAKAAIESIAEDEGPNPALLKENIKTSFSAESYTVGDNGALTIETQAGVTRLTVDGVESKNPIINEDGSMRWIFGFRVETAGSRTFAVVAYDETGASSEEIYATTRVEEPVEDDGNVEEPVNPDDEATDNIGSVIMGSESFVENLLQLLFGLFEKIFSMLAGGATA